MTSSVTRCPQCDTSFRVTEAHLNSARGAVRCGSCLHIFNAREHLIVEEPAPAPVKEEDDALFDDNQEEDSGIYSSDMESNVIMATTFGPAESNLFERDPIDDDDSDDAEDPDESWAESLLEDDDEEEAPAPIKVERKPEASNKRELFESHDTRSGGEGNFYGSQPPKPGGTKLTGDHFSMIGKLRESEKEYKPPSNRRKDPAADPGPTVDELEAGYEDEYLDDTQDDYIHTDYEEIDYGSASEPNLGNVDEIDDYAYQDQFSAASNSRFLQAIEPEPVEFNVVTSYPIWQSNALWTGLACAAGILLVIQLAIFRFDDLSVVQPWRGYYAKICGVFACELPALRDRSKIKTSNLVVRSHPAIDNALMVDAILRNTARFPQSFPPLDLVFIDIENQPVAARRFEAREYLGGELAGRKDMPVNQPVHIAIEISDPGPSAVSYFITIPE